MQAFAADKLSCKSGKLSILYDGKVTLEKGKFCTNKNGTVLISEDFDKKRLEGKTIGKTESVNPGWIFCRSLQGSPEFVKILIKDKWYELDRCLFSDGSYIDTGSLIGLGNSKKL